MAALRRPRITLWRSGSHPSRVKGLGVPMRRRLTLSLAALAITLGAGTAEGSTAAAGAAASTLSHERVLPYPMDQVWPTAVRYLRVDRGYAIVDRDPDVGYLLFEFPLGRRGSPEQTGRGSIEMFSKADASGRMGVQLKVTTDRGPPHLPHAVGEGIAAKVRAERGLPPPPPPTSPPKEPPEPDEDEDTDEPVQPPLVLEPNGPG